MMNITKSNYISCKQCEKLLWLEKYKPHVLDDKVTKQTAEGDAVGALARTYYQPNVTVKLGTVERMAEQTRALIAAGENIICEATFCVDGLSCAVDILRIYHSGEAITGVDIIEVKATTSVKDHQVDDVAFQTYVLERDGYRVNRVILMYLNSNYVRQGDLDVYELFCQEDVTVRAKGCVMTAPLIEQAREVLAETAEPDHELSLNCERPYECPAKAYCRQCKGIPEQSVFSVSGMTAAKKYAFYAQGIVTLEDLCRRDELLTKQQAACVRGMRGPMGSAPRVSTENVRHFLDGLQFPLYHLDFETAQYAIPKYNGTTPYQQVPFQYSLHIMMSPTGPFIHKEYLADPDEDPRDKLVEQLYHDIPMDVMSMAYNNAFEKMVCRALATQYPEYAEHLRNIADNMVDLMIPFRNRWVSTPSMHGSYSIKAVLPALCGNDPSIDYHRLPVVHNGAEAMAIFADMADGRIPRDEFADIRKGLLMYCGLDTLAMVKVLQKLYELIS